MIRIAVDAMGGDHAPREVVHGSVIAAREYGVAIQLVGPPDAIEKELTRHDHSGLDISIVAASEVVAMDEKPGRAIVKKKDSSIVVATKLVSDGKSDGLVAAGSTGAAAVAAQLGLGRIANVDRSAICCTMPATTGKCLLVDVGANVDCTPYQLMQFGVMGSIVSAGLFGKKNPTVGLLNIGTEETKGNELVQEAIKLLKQQSNINFIGFVEGRDFPLGKVDVTVTDGFTGNIALKTAEGIANMCKIMLQQELLRSTRTKLGAVVIKPALEGLKNRVDHNVFGGALLVGVKGVCVIAHGGSKHTAIKNAIRVAKDMVAADIVKKIENSFSMTAAGSKS